MDGRADESRSSLRELLEDVLFAGLGAAAITKDRADELVAELTRRGRMAPHEAREVVDEVTGRWRGEALRFGERSSSTVASFVRELGLVTRTEWEELELRLAQVEHRLRLVESARPETPGASPGAAPPHERRAR